MTICSWPQERTNEDGLLQQALQLVDIRAEGNPAFHMRAAVQSYKHGLPASKGQYDLKWRSPTSWREEIQLDNLRQLRIADGDRFGKRVTFPTSPKQWRMLAK